MNRNNQILSGILVVQLILVAIAFWPASTISGGGGAPLLGEFDTTAVVGLTIRDNENQQIEMNKNGENWVLASADDYPVDESKVTPVLEKLQTLNSNRLVTQTDSSHGRLKVANDDFERLVEVSLQDGTTHQLYIGTSGGPSATHVRLDGQNEVYLTGDLSMWDVNSGANSWIDTVYATLPPTATLALQLENANGTFEFIKEGENWNMAGLAEGEPFNSAAFTAMLNQTISLRMSEPIGKSIQPDFGLDSPRAVVVLHTTEGERVLQIGSADEEGNSVAKWSESEYYVYIPASSANNLVDKTRQDFLEVPQPAGGEGGGVQLP